MKPIDERWIETGHLAELGLQSAELIHELRQPVFAIKALAQLMAPGINGSEKAQMELLLGQVVQLEKLLERYTGAGRRPASQPMPVPFVRAVEAAAGIMLYRARKEGIELRVEVVEDPGIFQGDPVSIQQVLANLVRNAVDAARSRVDIRIVGSSVEVLDDGEGILPAIQGTMFEPFVSTKPPGKGTGLGLSLVRQLLDEMGGELVWSTDDRGTSFVVTFNQERARNGA